MIKTAAETFPLGTGLGADNMAPRAVAALPQWQLQMLADILNECEATGVWPKRWNLVLIALLPKPDGGRRPIGLFPAVVRIWMRTRAPALRQWEAENARSCLYGSAGMSATRAAWLSAWEAENAGKGEGAYAQALMDLVKAFETVPHDRVWEAAHRRGYPMAILRLALAAYAMPRSISSDGAFSRLVVAAWGITAGSGTATAELRAIIFDLIDIMSKEFPQIIPAIYVDDVNLEHRRDADSNRFPRPPPATPRHLARRMLENRGEHVADLIFQTTDLVARATNRAIGFFEALGMEVSASKSVATASSPAAARLLVTSVRKGKVRYVHPTRGQPAKMLGVGSRGGSTRTTKVFSKRVQAFSKKKRLFDVLKKFGFNTGLAVRATAMPSIGYGVETAGISDSALSGVRSLVNAAAGTSTGGGNWEAELFARDALHGRLDPSLDAHTKPLAAWATAWWDGWRSADQPTRSFKRADGQLRALSPGSKSIWSHVRGPTAAAIASASRIGWYFSAADKLHSDDGESFDLSRDSPAAIVNAVQRSVIRWRSANVLQDHTATKTLLQSPCFRPPHGVLPIAYERWRRAKAMASVRVGLASLDNTVNGRRNPAIPDSWQKRYAPYAISAIANKQWPQARCAALRSQDWDKDDTCKLCQEAAGTFLHRHTCRVVWPQPQPTPPNDVRTEMLTRTAGQVELWRTRGIGGTRVFTPHRSDDPTIEWIKEPDDHELPEHLDWYVDASQIDARTDAAVRFGIGAVATNRNGDLVAAMRGIPPRHVRSIPAAEA